tara:strand:- start:70919 stop:72331 length:1413 start_codon:yes stop_codon:yes gene_type:complete
MEDHSDFLPFDEEHDNYLIEKFEKMRSSKSVVYFDVEEFEELIDYYQFDENSETVQQIIQLAKEQHPDSTSLLLKEAETLVYTEKKELAVRIVQDISLFVDSNPEHYFSKALVLSMANHREKAIEVLKTLAEITPIEDQEDVKLAIAKEYQELGDYASAISDYQTILSHFPNSEDALLELSLTCELAGRNDEAISFINEFIDNNPYSHLAWFSAGNMYLSVENYEKAIWAFEYAILINEDFPEASFNMGNAYMKVENYELAIEAYKNSITYGYADPITYNFIGHCYIVLEQNETALEYFQLAVDQNPEYADGWLGFAVAYSNLNNSSEGLLYIEKAVKINPDNMYYRYFQADLFMNIGKEEEAEKLYQKVYESNLDNKGIFMDYAESLIINLKEEKALEVLVDGISKHPEESILYYRYAALMLALGHELDAESILFLALEIDPDKSSQFFDFYPDAGKYEGIMDLIENYK